MSDRLRQAVDDAVRQIIRASGEDVAITTTQRTVTTALSPSISGRPLGPHLGPRLGTSTGRIRSGNTQRSTGRSKFKNYY